MQTTQTTEARRRALRPLTAQQTWLAETLDLPGRRRRAHSGGAVAWRMSLGDSMAPFTPWGETGTSVDLDTLCQWYDGFSRLAKRLEMLVEGIADHPSPRPGMRSTPRPGFLRDPGRARCSEPRWLLALSRQEEATWMRLS